MRPTEILKEEHRIIKRMLEVLEAISDKLDAGEDISAESLEKTVDFIRTFADKYHHGKEEDLLFTRAELRGVPGEGGPIGVMLVEHEEGRGFGAAMAEAIERYARGEGDARLDYAKNARLYAALRLQHIDKEDNILYPITDNYLTEEDQKELLERFDEVKCGPDGGGKREEYLLLLAGWEEEYLNPQKEENVMAEKGKTVTLDVRDLSPWERHPRIFETFDALEVGEVLKLVNDHDPRPLHYELMHEREGQFEWTSEEKAPREWVAMIERKARV